MIIDVPFVYRGTVVPLGKRKSTARAFKDVVPVFVEDLTIEQAKLAFRCGPPPHFHVEKPPAEIFLTADRLIAPIAYNYLYQAGDERVPTKSNLPGRVAVCTSEDNPFHADQDRHRNWAAAQPFVAAEWRKLEHDDRESRMSSIKRSAADWAFVGETMCHTAAEPVWHVAPSPSNRQMLILLRRSDMEADRMLPDVAIFRVDRLDAAKAFAERRTARLGFEQPVHHEGEVEVLIPAAVRFDDAAWAARKAASEGLKWHLKEGHHELDGAMAEFDRVMRGGAVGPGLGEALSAVSGHLQGHGLGHLAGDLEDYAALWQSSRSENDLPEEMEMALSAVDAGALQ